MFPYLSWMVLLTLRPFVCATKTVNCKHCGCYFSTLHPQSLAPPVWACPPPLTHTDNHTHTQGTWSYDAFYGFKAMCSWMDRLKTKYLNDSWTQRSPLVTFVSVVLLKWMCVSMCVHLSGKCLSPQATVCVSSSHACPWGFWEWTWCVCMVSGVSAVMTNRCILLLAPAVRCIDGRRAHNHTQPQAFVQISASAC